MSIAILDAPTPKSVVPEFSLQNLALCTEKLAALRFMVVLATRWESCDSIDWERRQQVRLDLVRLRRLYSEKIDEIAMRFGVQEAMDAKEDVERRVAVPQGIELPASTCEHQDPWF